MRVSRSSWVLIAVVIVLVNLPIVHSTWTRSSVERSGVEVAAEVTEARNLGSAETPSWWLSYRLPKVIDPEQAIWSAEVDAAAYEKAEAAGTVPVRVIEGRPATAIVEGEVRSSAGLVGTLAADAVLLAMLLLLWRFRGRGRREVETVEALEDVSLARPGASWEDLGDGTVRVTGEVLDRDEHEVVLDLGDRLVRVVLDGHANQVGYQQPAQVRVRPTS
jgi:hypothetical protein